MREDPDRGMLCIDWDGEEGAMQSEPIEITGQENDDDYARLEVVLVPCNYVHTQLGYSGDTVSPECEGDLTK